MTLLYRDKAGVELRRLDEDRFVLSSRPGRTLNIYEVIRFLLPGHPTYLTEAGRFFWSLVREAAS